MFYDAVQAILACADDFDGTDPSLQRQPALGMNGLKIGRAARELALLLARPVPEHIDSAAYRAPVERGLLGGQKRLQAREPVRFDRLRRFARGVRRRACLGGRCI